MTWLVTGACGYIGSHVAHLFNDNGLKVFAIDNLQTGFRTRLPSDFLFFEGDCSDSISIKRICDEHNIIGVVHMAAKKMAGESVREPLSYWTANTNALLGILNGIKGTNVSSFVLSSSCSVYGSSNEVTELSPLSPLSPYGRTKYYSEQILLDVAQELSIKVMILRYFNVIGNSAKKDSVDRSPECLLPAVYDAIVNGSTPNIYGNKYDTFDGTCLRDYLDVRDLADAHYRSAQFLQNMSDSNYSGTFNVGIGQPRSVLEMVSLVCEAMDVPVKYVIKPPRKGDPAAVWSNAHAIGSLLDWKPIFSIEESVKSYVEGRRANG